MAVLTGNVLKDTEYIYRYHTGELTAYSGPIQPTYGNRPMVVPNDAEAIVAVLGG